MYWTLKCVWICTFRWHTCTWFIQESGQYGINKQLYMQMSETEGTPYRQSSHKEIILQWQNTWVKNHIQLKSYLWHTTIYVKKHACTKTITKNCLIFSLFFNIFTNKGNHAQCLSFLQHMDLSHLLLFSFPYK